MNLLNASDEELSTLWRNAQNQMHAIEGEALKRLQRVKGGDPSKVYMQDARQKLASTRTR